MNIKELILKRIKEREQVTVSDIVKETGFSRAYVQRDFKELVEKGELSLVGKSNRAFYVSGKTEVEKTQKIIRKLNNTNLKEDIIWNNVKRSNLFEDVPGGVVNVLSYAFTEMLNNAIEHSGSKDIEIKFEKVEDSIVFNINDAGVGILNNIKNKKKLKNKQEAIQDLLKGKQTTMSEAHSGEGIFFTSKVADKMIIYASGKKIIFDNRINDIFVKDNPQRRGTRVYFEIDKSSKRKLENVFKKYTGESFEFGKTEVLIKLYEMGTEYISRSQARRVIVGLDKFKYVILDFDKVGTVGQGFADEIFQVWQNNHPKIKIDYRNANDNVELMIKRSKNN